MIVGNQQKAMVAVARSRFDELDVDKSGFLENAELLKVAEWVMQYFGSKLGKDKDVVLTRLMKRLDGNKDGKLDPTEFEQLFLMVVTRTDLVSRATHKFKEFDSDGSGFIEAKEIDEVITWTLQAFPNDQDVSNYKNHLLSLIDTNGDGKLDLAEFIVLFEDMVTRLDLIERARAKFTELDSDGSGQLELPELDKVAEWVLAAYDDRSVKELAEFKSTLLKRLDVNKDGKLSLQEFAVLFDEILLRVDLIAQAKKAFSKLDADGSGYLEKEELGKVLVFWASVCGSKIGIDPTAPIEELLSKLDANSDGKLSLEEFIPLFDAVTVSCGMWSIPE